MQRREHPDLFGDEPRHVAVDADIAPPRYQPNVDDARARLNRILGEARAAEMLPWDADKTLV